MIKLTLTSIVLFFPAVVFASTETHGPGITHQMTDLVLQLGVILFAARLGGQLFKKMKLPSVLGELMVGIVIGPYMLGSIALPGFENGFFPLQSVQDSSISVSPELYGIATLASIILLFIAGLETNLDMFIRFSVAGSVIGISGVVLSFVLGAATGMYFLDLPFTDPRCLFLGIMATPTSVGITARILSERRKLDSPEGVTILSAAVIDDILGIILLAVVLGFATVVKSGQSSVDGWSNVGTIAGKAIGVWLIFTLLGLLFSQKISAFLKSFKNVTVFSVLGFGLALLLAGIFEKAGLAMIIGAYVMGLSLSKTDISMVIQENLNSLHAFLVPVFFTVMGMLVDVKALFSGEILLFGLVYTVFAVISKLVGSGIPALFFNFNRVGALRTGLGMVFRGEVVLIMAGIGLSYGVLNHSTFGIAIVMIFVTTILGPVLLNAALSIKSGGTRKKVVLNETVTTRFDFPTKEFTDLVETKVIQNLRNEGFYLHKISAESKSFHCQKDTTVVLFHVLPLHITFESSKYDVAFIKTIAYETLLNLHITIDKVKDLAKPESLKKDIVTENGTKYKFDLRKALDPASIIMELKAENKYDSIKELVDVLAWNGKIKDKDSVLEAVWERETTMSTGMQYGVALPHSRTGAVNKITVAIGFKREGIDFQALDKLPSRVIVLILSPIDDVSPHIQFLSGISSHLNTRENVGRLLQCENIESIYAFFKKG